MNRLRSLFPASLGDSAGNQHEPRHKGTRRCVSTLAPSLWLLSTLAAILLSVLVLSSSALAQDTAEPESYTVVPGDTLFEIASRFGITLEELVAANNITNVDLIDVGQVLVIPDASAAGQLSVAGPVVRARPGETLPMLARRIEQDPAALATLNELPEQAGLFPGQPIRVAEDAATSEPPSFGAIVEVAYPDALAQGKTGKVVVTARRPVDLRADWNGLPLAFTPYADDALRQFAYLPVPALLDPGPYPLTISYAAANGANLSRTWSIPVVEGGYDLEQINLPPDRGALLDPELVQSELQLVTERWSVNTPQLLWTEAFTRPIAAEYETTAAFGTRRSYNGGPYASYHAGQDFGAPVGITVTAPADAVVALTEPLNVRGNAILLDHGRGIFTGYWHLDQSFVQTGQAVTAGEPIGVVGNTGLSTGAHLHWELRIYGIAVDPMQFMTEPLRP